ncbi:MAG: hypothetical protein NVS4B4_16480 [Bradyrhizobium sp.]
MAGGEIGIVTRLSRRVVVQRSYNARKKHIEPIKVYRIRFRSCIGILGLTKRYDAERLDAACARALALGTRSYSSVATILKNAQDRKAADPEQPSLFHENIRGSGYYH